MLENHRVIFLSLLEEQEKSHGKEKILKAGDIFEYIRVNKQYIKYNLPVVYSIAVQKAITFERKVKHLLRDKNNTQEDIQHYQECLAKINLFQWNI
jgi:hypothetical protein